MPLGSHRVPLVGHCGGADLFGLERFLDLSLVGQEAEVGAESVGAFGDSVQGVDRLCVDLACVGLAGDGEDVGEAERLGHHVVECLDLGVVTVEEGEEAGLGSGGALDPQKLQVGESALDFMKIENQLVAPERGPFAHGDKLRGLKMGVAQSGEVLPGLGEVGKRVD